MTSKTKTRSLHFSIHEFMKSYKTEMSFEHFHGMTKRLKAMFGELHLLGYECTHLGRIKKKHIEILVKHWQSKNLSIATIKNRMSDLRLVCKELGRSNVILNNEGYGIGQRSYIPTHNKAIVSPNFEHITDPYLKLSLELQRVFGLRREECIKIMPHIADQGDYLWLKPTWTKGGIERSIPIRTQEQRYWLDQAKLAVQRKESLIPKDKNYIEQRRYYDRATAQAGLNKLHGLRHAYAQKRYHELTGWEAPINGGTLKTVMNKSQRLLDRTARMTIAIELGHSRVAIAKNYLG